MSDNDSSEMPTRRDKSQSSIIEERLNHMLRDVSEKLSDLNKAHEAASNFLAKCTSWELELSRSIKHFATASGELQSRSTETSLVINQINASAAKVNDIQAVVAAKSEHIEQAREHADKVRSDLDHALTSAISKCSSIDGELHKIQACAESAANFNDTIKKYEVGISASQAMMATTCKAAEAASQRTQILADQAQDVEEAIKKRQAELQDIDAECKKKLVAINDLLRGATTAGLASSFDRRRETFRRPNSLWQIVFLLSILSLVALAGSALWHSYSQPTSPEWGELARLWIMRMPVAGALVWLALHASREAALSKRLEEDYGYKAAIAACFEGFRKQMTEIDHNITQGGQLEKLCENTLAIISNSPSKIYESHKLTVTPADSILDGIKGGDKSAE